MSIQYDRLGAEMEVNPRLQQAIVVHHIIQVVRPVVGIIICGATSHFILMLVLLVPIIPIILFIIFWIASKCNYHDLRLILVHFNFILSMLWLITVFPVFFISSFVSLEMYPHRYSETVDVAAIVVAVINGFLSLSSVIFAVCGIWKSARNVVLRARFAKREHIEGLSRLPPPYGAPNTFTDLNGI